MQCQEGERKVSCLPVELLGSSSHFCPNINMTQRSWIPKPTVRKVPNIKIDTPSMTDSCGYPVEDPDLDHSKEFLCPGDVTDYFCPSNERRDQRIP